MTDISAAYRTEHRDIDVKTWRARIVAVARNHGSIIVSMNAEALHRADVSGLQMPFPVSLVEAIETALGPRACAVLNAMEEHDA